SQEKKKPGTISKVFNTHPMTGDRITAVRALVARFPEQPEYAINTSEFSQVKSRLVSQNVAQHMNRGDDNRPTLKRRRSGRKEGDPSDPQPPERPTLKHSGEPDDSDS